MKLGIIAVPPVIRMLESMTERKSTGSCVDQLSMRESIFRMDVGKLTFSAVFRIVS